MNPNHAELEEMIKNIKNIKTAKVAKQIIGEDDKPK